MPLPTKTGLNTSGLSIQAPNSKRQAKTSGLDFAIELGETIDKIDHHVGMIDHANKGMKYLSASQAFRKYNWIKGVPVKNVSETLRGMVVSKDWKYIYDITVSNEEFFETAGKVFLISGIAFNILKSLDKIKRISASDEDTAHKGQRYIAIGSMAIFNTVSAPVPMAVHLIAAGVMKACDLTHSPASYAAQTKAFDVAVQSKYQTVMDSDNVVDFINLHLEIK